MKSTGLRHKFPWKNQMFCELYFVEINAALGLNEKDILDIFHLDQKAFVENIFDKIPKMMFRSARLAEKKLGLSTSNGVRRGELSSHNYSSEALAYLSEIRKLHDAGLSSSHVAVKELKREFRKLQRRGLYVRDRNNAFRLESLLKNDKPKFWKSIANYRRKNKRRAVDLGERPSAIEFVEYYGKVFSHHDREMNAEHKLISDAVLEYNLTLSDIQGVDIFSYSDISESIDSLKLRKAAGFDGLSNEFFKYGSTEGLLCLLLKFFNAVVSHGHLPDAFNTSVLVPIPKKQGTSSPGDYRPISVSSTLATLFESLLLMKMDWIRNFSKNQFGYRNNTSCKTAFFVANEVIQYYTHNKSNMHVVSLDAAKAFDKLWRHGLFFKLKDKISSYLWRILFKYYNESFIIVNVDSLASGALKTTEGCKQGGILSPFLFNFFIDDLLLEVNSLGIGASIAGEETSILAYFDDILLLASTTGHMNTLLETCHRYASKWKLVFNADKSSAYSSKH